MDIDLLKRICLIPSPSNDENRLVEFLTTFKFKHFKALKCKTNSLIFESHPFKPDKKRVLIDAHLDQVHMRILKYNQKRSTVLAQPVGFRAGIVRGTTVEHFETGLPGVVHRVAPHFTKVGSNGDPEEQRQTVNIEFGQDTKFSEANFLPGDSVVFTPHFHQIGPYLVGSSGLDNRVSVYILLLMLTTLDSPHNFQQLNCNLAVNLSGREEIAMGNFGHFIGSEFDEIIVLDAIPSTDMFDPEERRYSLVKQGHGPVITRDFEDHRAVGKSLVETAQQSEIPYQLSFSNSMGSSNSRFYSRLFNARVQSLGVPVDNMHSYTETTDKRDIAWTRDLLTQYLRGLH